MKKLSEKAKRKFERSANSLFGLFKLISFALPASTAYAGSDGSYSIKQGKLLISYSSLQVDFEKKVERLIIRQTWPDGMGIEQITITDELTDSRKWIVSEVLQNLALVNDGASEMFQEIITGKTAYGHPVIKESFASDLAGCFFELSQSSFEYSVSSVSKGLMSLSYLPCNGGGLDRVYRSMIHDAEVANELKIKLGPSTEKRWREYLKQHLLNTSKSFSFHQNMTDGLSSWSDSCEGIINLCRLYAESY